MALSGGSHGGEFTSAFGGAAEVHGRTDSAAFDANDPQEALAELKSRNAAVSRDAEVCYPFHWKHRRDLQ